MICQICKKKLESLQEEYNLYIEISFCNRYNQIDDIDTTMKGCKDCIQKKYEEYKDISI